MNEIVELITTLGFPMIACIVIYLDMRKDKDRLYAALDSFGEKLERFDATLKRLEGKADANGQD